MESIGLARQGSSMTVVIEDPLGNNHILERRYVQLSQMRVACLRRAVLLDI
jgi:C4-type Zn-finger protein